MSLFSSLHGNQRWHLLEGQQGPGNLFHRSRGLGTLHCACLALPEFSRQRLTPIIGFN